MSIPVWPSELLPPLVDGFRKERDDVRKFARGQNGPPRTRRRVSKAAQYVSASFWCTDDQRARFWRFFEDETADGVRAFIVPAWGETDKPLLTSDGLDLLTGTGAPILTTKDWLCMFGEQMPVEEPLGLQWRISLSLVILP